MKDKTARGFEDILQASGILSSKSANIQVC
jgi:hypothetical protein